MSHNPANKIVLFTVTISRLPLFDAIVAAPGACHSRKDDVYGLISMCLAWTQIESRLLGSTRSYRWWEEQELKELTSAVGLQGFERNRSNRFIMFCVSKPSAL